MSKPARIEFEGAWYHVTNRALSHVTAFRTVRDYEAFLQTLCEAAERHRLEIHAYCLLPDRYHLLVRTPAANLNRAMRQINGVYTQDFQAHHGVEGPVFRGRYRAVVLEPDAYLLPLSRAIHRLPVDAPPSLATDPSDWYWSSAPDYCGTRARPSWLHVDAVAAALGPRDDGHAYASYLRDGLDPEMAAYLRRRRLPAVLGGSAFRQRCREHARADSETPKAAWQVFLSFEQVLAAVERGTGVPRSAVLARGRRGGTADAARPLAMAFCQARAGLTLKEIGSAFGDIHYSAVAQAIRRARARAERDPGFRETLDRIRAAMPASGGEAANDPDDWPTGAPADPAAGADAGAQPAPSHAPLEVASPSEATHNVEADDIMAYLDSLPGHVPDSPPDPLAPTTESAARTPAGSATADSARRRDHRSRAFKPSGGTGAGATDGDALDVDTMLDLARSYVDLGDAQSALELIGEITELGSAHQRRQAWRIRASL